MISVDGNRPPSVIRRFPIVTWSELFQFYLVVIAAIDLMLTILWHKQE